MIDLIKNIKVLIISLFLIGTGCLAGTALGISLNSSNSNQQGNTVFNSCEDMGCGQTGPECVETTGKANCIASPEDNQCTHTICGTTTFR